MSKAIVVHKPAEPRLIVCKMIGGKRQVTARTDGEWWEVMSIELAVGLATQVVVTTTDKEEAKRLFKLLRQPHGDRLVRDHQMDKIRKEQKRAKLRRVN